MDTSKMSLNKIKNFFLTTDINDYKHYIGILKSDKRKTVKNYGVSLEKKYNKHIRELKRLKSLWEIEDKLSSEGYSKIVGIDEVGRGPLAGPVVAAAVILPPNTLIPGVDDSKKISLKKRNDLYNKINTIAIDIGIGIVDNETIDKINILNATKLAMKNAINSLSIKPDFLLIDAVKLTDINIKQKNIIKGDSLSISIAAASIIAKVTRDNIVDEYEKKYIGYGFNNHKGYGTKEHYDAIKKLGITPVHRKTFLKTIR